MLLQGCPSGDGGLDITGGFSETKGACAEYAPQQLAVDPKTGNILPQDPALHTIRKIEIEQYGGGVAERAKKNSELTEIQRDCVRQMRKIYPEYNPAETTNLEPKVADELPKPRTNIQQFIEQPTGVPPVIPGGACQNGGVGLKITSFLLILHAQNNMKVIKYFYHHQKVVFILV